MDSSCDIGGECVARESISVRHGGLCRQMKQDACPALPERCSKSVEVPNVAVDGRDAFAYPCPLEKTGLGRRRQRIRCHVSADTLQPKRKPCALETSVSGKKDPAVAPEVRVHDQWFRDVSQNTRLLSREFSSLPVVADCQIPFSREGFMLHIATALRKLASPLTCRGTSDGRTQISAIALCRCTILSARRLTIQPGSVTAFILEEELSFHVFLSKCYQSAPLATWSSPINNPLILK